MPDVMKLVEAKLGSRADREALALWNAIWESYERGGPEAVETELLKREKAIKSAAVKEMKATKKMVPKRKSRKRRR